MAAQARLSPDPALSEAQLRALRCRTDRLGIVAVLAATTAAPILLPGVGSPALLIAAVMLGAVVTAVLHVASVCSNGLPIGPNLRATWDQAAQAACTRAGVRRECFALLLIQDPHPNAYAGWSPFGRCVVVTSGLAELLAEDVPAQEYILGHELAHLLFHQPWSMLAGSFAALPLPLAALGRLLVLGWSRAAERTADRLGLLVCASPTAAARALLALHSGHNVPRSELRRLLADLPHRPGGLAGYLAEALTSHPFLRPRLEAMVAFAAGQVPAALVGQDTAEAMRWELVELGFVVDRVKHTRFS